MSVPDGELDPRSGNFYTVQWIRAMSGHSSALRPLRSRAEADEDPTASVRRGLVIVLCSVLLLPNRLATQLAGRETRRA